jgi:hypothetical protein
MAMPDGRFIPLDYDPPAIDEMAANFITHPRKHPT